MLVDPCPGDQRLVSELVSALVAEIGSDRFELYFEEQSFRVVDGRVEIGAETEFALTQIRSRFGNLLPQIVTRLWGAEVAIDFRIQEPRVQGCLFSDAELPMAKATEAASRLPKRTRTRVEKESRSNRQPTLEQLGLFANSELPRAPEPLPRQSSGAAAAGQSRESALVHGVRSEDSLGLPPAARAGMTLTSFQFGTNNSLAKAATDQVIQRPGQISPLVLFGPVGSGKTHLATALGQHLRRRVTNYSVLQLSAEQFTTRFLQALNGSGLPSLRSQFRDVDLLILEDIQFFQGKKATLVELQHTIDSLLRLGKQLILTTDRHPNDLSFLSSEIQTRLVSGLVIPLQLPDREARVAICQRWCEQWRLTTAPGMIEWLADHVAGDTRRLSGALFRLLATQSSRGALVQPHEAMEILSDYAITHGQLCSLSMIQKAVCGLCGIEPADLNGAQRTRKISGARMLAMYLARKHTPAALAEIGEFFGGRRHSTVVAAEKRIRTAMQKNENLETAARPLNLREAIRKVETQLKTG